MMNVTIMCVNYHTYDLLRNYIRSVEVAAARAKGTAAVKVFVADNTERSPQPFDYGSDTIEVKVFPYHENLGYFGGIGRLWGDAGTADCDYLIISNVDVVMSEDFFTTLNATDANGTGWIAPKIFSTLEKRDRNPKIVARYTLRRLQVLRLMFKYPLLHRLYVSTLYRRKKLGTHQPGPIYAGHGSFIILTKEYIRKCGRIDYPIFLFGEEIYLAEKCRDKGLAVIYSPNIAVHDNEHASTGDMHLSTYYHYNYKALDYVIRTFYR